MTKIGKNLAGKNITFSHQKMRFTFPRPPTYRRSIQPSKAGLRIRIRSGIRIGSGFRIRIQEGKNDPQK
jgi:hypothetical protein